MTTDTATTPEPIDLLPPLVGAIVDRQLEYVRAVVDHVLAGGAIDEEFRRRGDESNADIRRELVEPHGADGVAAAEDAARRMLYATRVVAGCLGIDVPDGA